MKDGKVVRWIDYWDGWHFGSDLAAKMHSRSDRFPTDFREASVADNASATIRAVAVKLHAAFAGNYATAAAALLGSDAVYEDMTLRAQVLGKLAIERNLGRALSRLPYDFVVQVRRALAPTPTTADQPPASAFRIEPNLLRYCAGVRLTWRRNSRPKKPASS